MKSKLLLLLFLPLITFSQTQLGENFTNPDENRIKPSKYGTGISISEDGTIAAVGAPGNNEDSFVRVYKYQNNTWEQLGNDIVNESILEKVGSSVSLSADGLTIAIGAVDGGNLDEGHIRIYKFIDNNWVKQGDDIVGDGTQFYLGYKVVLSTDAKFLAATAYRTNSSKKGTVKVYENISDVWTQRGTNLEGEFNYDAFGFTIDLSDDGNVLAIGNKGRQKIQIFKFENNDWVQIGSDFTNLKPGSRQGLSVSLSSNGNRVAVGASGVSIYENNNGNWNLLGSKISYGSYSKLSSDGNKIVIGDPYYSKVRYYNFENNTWSQRGNEIETWRNSRLGSVLSLTADGDTVFAFPVVYTFNNVILSVKNNLLEKKKIVFPNPTNGEINIQFSNEFKLQKVIIFNALGSNITSSFDSSIDISEYPKGIYFVKIITNKGFTTRKIIKN